jgi:hypothetical protein
LRPGINKLVAVGVLGGAAEGTAPNYAMVFGLTSQVAHLVALVKELVKNGFESL